MPMINITQRDMLRSVIVEPAWYRVHVDNIGQKTANSGNSQNFPIEGTILFNADNGDTKHAGVPTPQGWLFNEGAIGFAVGFLVACGADENDLKQAVASGKGRFELTDAQGKDIDVFIENGTWEGRSVNKINHKYRKPNPAVQART